MSIDVYPSPQAASAASVLAFLPITFSQVVANAGTALTGFTTQVYVPPGRTIKVSAWCYVQNNTADARSQLFITEDGVQKEAGFVHHSTAGINTTIHAEVVLQPSPGVHTYAVSGGAQTGTATFAGDGAYQARLLVEDITGGTGGPGPLLLDYKQLTATQAGITGTLVDVTNLSCTVKVPAGRALRITSKMQVLCTVATGDIYIPILEDGVTKGRVTYRTLTVDQYMNPMGSIVVFPTPGTHTYKVQAAKWSGGGGMEVRPAADNPAYIMVEDITGTEAPTGAYYEAFWTPATLLNGWTNYDVNTYPAAAYRKVNDLVYLRGLVRNGTIGASGFNLPVGYRPLRNHHFLVNGNDLPCSVRVLMGGDVWIGTGSQSNVWIDIGGIVFGVT